MNSRSALIFAGGSSAELLIAAVLATLTSEKTKQAYAAALTEFLAWITARGEPLLETWRGSLLARGLAVSSINQRLSAVRLLLRQAPIAARCRSKKLCGSPPSPISSKAGTGWANGSARKMPAGCSAYPIPTPA
jgi:hypothetical protein